LRIVIPGTDLNTSRTGFGTASLHRLWTESARQSILSTAWDCGIRHFDTAPYYGHTLAEKSVGVFLRGKRQEAVIATKVGILASPALAKGAVNLYLGKMAMVARRRLGFPGGPSRIDFSSRGSPTLAEKSLTSSLRSLQTDYVDILFLHEPDGHPLSDEFTRWLESVKDRGMARFLGAAGDVRNVVSVVSPRKNLLAVTQVRDSTAGREADYLDSHELQKQITFGYFRTDGGDIHDYRARNPHGVILVGSTKPGRIRSACSA
jgi:aryl-alcohol dehydrogenase-like predicted oxidoreductase